MDGKKNLNEKRNDELINIKQLFILVALRTFVNSNLSILTSLATIGGYTYFNGPMEIDSSTKIIEEVAEPMINIPQYITDLESLKISLDRVQNFLIIKDIEKIINEENEKNENEKEENVENKNNEDKEVNNNENKNENQIAIDYKNCDFGIKRDKNEENKVLLKDFNLSINKGE